MRSIQTKLTVTIIVIFLAALGTLGGLNYWKARSILTETITASMQKEAASAADDVGAWIAARKNEVLMMATGPVIVSGNKEAMVPFLKGATDSNKAYESISYADPTGDTITAAGTKVNSADRDYFKRALAGEVVISDPLVSRATNRYVMMVAVPVKANGRVTGVLTGVIDFEVMAKTVGTIKVGQTGFAYILQGDGLVIVHPNKEYVMKSNPLKDANADPGQKALTAQMVKGEKGLATQTTVGVERYFAYAPVPGTKWSLGVAVPSAEVTGAVSALTWITLVTILVVLILAVVAISIFARRIANPIRQLETAANRIAGGDITETRLGITTNDEIGRLGQAFETMAGNLRSLIKQVAQASDQVAASSEELTASAEQSSQASSQIAASITDVAAVADEQLEAASEASAVVEQMSAGIQQVAAGANQVAAQSARAADKAADGGQAVDKAVSQMSRVEDTVTRSAAVVAKLGDRSKEIGQIVDTIAGIAGQTNLLALNAAIEAARAGEQGRGFAVVAEEVRRLAEQSQEAAGKIAQLIGEIQGDTDKAVIAMNDGTREVKTGAEVVNAAGAAFREIADLVTLVSKQMKESSAAIQQIAGGSQQIVGAVKKIDDLGKKAAAESQTVSAAAEEQLASMEEIASSSRALAKMAEELTQAVSRFRV
jgi:methyl-accepting chemotaxis protein